MPGLIGFTHPYWEANKTKSLLDKMLTMMHHYDFYRRDDIFSNQEIAAGRCHNQVLQKEMQPYRQSHYYFWLDGEFYNQKALGFSQKSDPEIFCLLYQEHQDFSFLQKIDGIFSAVFYDVQEQKIYLISDRRGLRTLYWTVQGQQLLWTSELKTLKCWPDFDPQWNKTAIAEFLGLRYFLGNETWFKGVERLPAATVLTWNCQTQSLSQSQYWSWSDIEPLDPKLTESDLINRVGERFIEAVKCRSRWGEKIGISLSGGLDSRFILAAMPHQDQPIIAVSYGQKNCQDLSYAQQAAYRKGAEFYVVEMNGENWLETLVDKVWQTDGTISLVHMHLVPTLRFIRQNHLFDFNFNGTPGDANLGCSNYFNEQSLEYFLSRKLGLRNFAISPEHYQLILQRFQELYQQCQQSSYWVYMASRLRTFVSKDARLSLLDGVEARLPFLDNALEELLFKIPEQWKQDNNFYNHVLLHTFPEYFKQIPRQSTGQPIGPPTLIQRWRSSLTVTNQKIQRRAKSWGIIWPSFSQFSSSQPINFADYGTWFRQNPAKALLEDTLFHSQTIYQTFIPRSQVENDWHRHLSGEDLSDKLSLVLTLELWLQQFSRI